MESGKSKMKSFVSIMLIILDVIFLVMFVLFIPTLLWHIVGPDFIELENWSGEISNPIRYCFGAGTCEFIFIVTRLIAFIIIQIGLLKDNSKVRKTITILVHTVIGVIGMIYFFVCADGANIIYNLQLIFDR